MNLITKDINLFTDIFPKLNFCITRFGSAELRNMLTKIEYDETNLLKKQNIIKEITTNLNKKTKLKKLLIQIYDSSKILNEWLSYEYNISDLYSKYGIKNSYWLTFTNKLKFLNAFIVWFSYFIIYLMMIYWGIKMSFTDYICSIYNGYVDCTQQCLRIVSSYDTINLILAHTFVICYQLYTIYNALDDSYDHYCLCNDFMDNYKSMNKIIKYCKKIYDDSFLEKDKDIENYFDKLFEFFDPDSSLGNALIVFLDKDYIDPFNNVLNYIGKIDAFISVSNLLYDGYSLPSFVFDSDKPIILIDEVWNPVLNYEKQVKNDFIGQGLTIITAPNKSGKSTFLRSVFLAIYLAQSIGVSCSKEIIFTPFKYLFTYLNIPDTIGRESLFEAELNRLFIYYQNIMNLKDGEFTFSIIDELLTGTTPNEGSAASYAICKYISENKNNISIVSTHFRNVFTDIENVQFLKLIAEYKNDIYSYPYILYPGISDQYIALELLKERGYDEKITKYAHDKLKIQN